MLTPKGVWGDIDSPLLRSENSPQVRNSEE